MPYICVARSDIPDGTVQVLDLAPNTSQYTVNSPVGQSAYFNRAQNDVIALQSDGTLVYKDADGLSAYLLANVEPGGNEQATGTITVAGALHGDTIVFTGNGGAPVTLTATANQATGTVTFTAVNVNDTITVGGVVFTAKAAENIAAKQFNQSAGDAATATSFRAVLNDATNQSDIITAFGGTCTAGVPAGNATVLTATTAYRGLVGKVSVTESTAGARIVRSGLTANALTLVLAVPASYQFNALAGVADNTAAAASLVLTINEVTTVVPAMKAEFTTPPQTLRYPFATSALAVVTMVARRAASATLKGYGGDLGFVPSNLTRLVPNTGAAITDRMYRAFGQWTAAQAAATSAAVLARVDAGSALELADVNTVLLTNAGAELTGVGDSISTGVLTEFLSVLAGRGYKILRYPAGSTTPYQFMASAAPTSQWAGGGGSFTEAVTTYGNTMSQGEIVPATAGGDTIQREYKPIRHIIDTDSLQISLALGTLAAFTVQAGPPAAPPVTLWPDSGDGRGTPHFPWIMQPGTPVAQVDNARVLTVYSDTGVVLT